jgi:hypothetical protein
LSFTVSGQEPGTILDGVQAGQTIRVRAEARSVLPFDVLEVVVNGTVVAEAQVTGSPARAALEVDLPVEESGWLAARCRGQHLVYHRPANQRVFAHTSPVYLHVEGRPRLAEQKALTALTRELEKMLAWASREARCETDQQRERLVINFRSAHQELLRRQS